MTAYPIHDPGTGACPCTPLPGQAPDSPCAAHAAQRAETLADGVEVFDAAIEDWWVCPCGNNPGWGGHIPCDEHGRVRTTWDGWNDAGAPLVCVECGRYARTADRDPETGRVPVAGRAEPPTLAELEESAVL